MNYTIKMERLFSLGDYKNIKVIVEATEIPDDKWNDVTQMNNLRSQLASEVLLGFAIEQMTETELAEYIKSRDFTNLLTELLVNRHENLRTDFTVIPTVENEVQ